MALDPAFKYRKRQGTYKDKKELLGELSTRAIMMQPYERGLKEGEAVMGQRRRQHEIHIAGLSKKARSTLKVEDVMCLLVADDDEQFGELPLAGMLSVEEAVCDEFGNPIMMEVDAEEDTEFTWVYCGKCDKSRVISSDLACDLPAKWDCSMAPCHGDCNDPQEGMDEGEYEVGQAELGIHPEGGEDHDEIDDDELPESANQSEHDEEALRQLTEMQTLKGLVYGHRVRRQLEATAGKRGTIGGKCQEASKRVETLKAYLLLIKEAEGGQIGPLVDAGGNELATPTSSTDEEEVELTLLVAERIQAVLKEVVERVETTNRDDDHDFDWRHVVRQHRAFPIPRARSGCGDAGCRSRRGRRSEGRRRQA